MNDGEWIVRRNIERYTDLLESSSDDLQKEILGTLLREERKKLPAQPPKPSDDGVKE
ncbi:hypothetical protein [Altererythrobacter sp. ZODW24]|uniref:hypothetical protein n=1 Tax=Altererythrobacter sp. ZODW24 TaxID=2185142 RepID=UPI0013B4282C|nr:hypothetical protein [Altererythrobacter sp. ZODW24]